ncbi:restriction endonuclease, partial [Guyparkeria halopsychrophila]|uniref:restriction endonuclease n=1 Tax=Guyparkeria halopsychrophila TaxID=3139421 RepID=UPI0037C84BBE
MASPLYDLLERYRNHAKTDREMGTYFEELVKAYFEHDDVQTQHYDKVWTYGDWAEEQGLSRKDTGIDLVARVREDHTEFCAIQCKFYDKNHRLQRADLDSFFTASNRKPFTRRILIDTTEVDLGSNAQALFDDTSQYVKTNRIGLRDLEESRIDWTIFSQKKEVVYRPKKKLRSHQKDALEAVRAGLTTADRGKLIMACGTGKTFAALKIAEDLAGQGKRVLFMVPSLALMSQTVTEWSNDSTVPLRSFAACSDSQIGKRRASDDIAELQQHDLAFPATTNPAKLVAEANQVAPDAMTVVFSTYQSIQVISDAQKLHGLPEFDLIICDEAHRTTGVTLSGEDESNFVRIHDNEHVKGKKRLYMTATPRIFGEAVKGKADEGGHELTSMDDMSKFGEVLFYRGFSWAVENDLLTDYKVIILAMDEGLVSRGLQKALSSGTNELQLDDASRIIGCYKALTKATLKDDIQYDTQPMRRALAFCRDIKSSQLIESQFSDVVEEYLEYHAEEGGSPDLHCSIGHVDGTFNAKKRNVLLDWLKAEPEDHECRILTNARCLSEGVDVPALDAIMFLHPRKSQIDVVQSVGRVMRKAGPDKRMGYVILPIGVPTGVTPEQALNDNEKHKVVWQILNALRAHDERFDATINKASLGERIDNTIQIVGIDSEELRAVTAEVDTLPSKSSGSDKKKSTGIGVEGEGEPQADDEAQQLGMDFNMEVGEAILAKIVKKCGTRDYWEDWATDIADIAHKHIVRIKGTLDSVEVARNAFDEFLLELRDDLNGSITEDEAVEMLAQHIITRPVFETLFEGHQFTKENPVSKGIQQVLDVLNEHRIDKESKALEKFYESVKRRSQGIQTAQGKQRLVVELYDKFFRKAFPRLTQ